MIIIILYSKQISWSL